MCVVCVGVCAWACSLFFWLSSPTPSWSCLIALLFDVHRLDDCENCPCKIKRKTVGKGSCQGAFLARVIFRRGSQWRKRRRNPQVLWWTNNNLVWLYSSSELQAVASWVTKTHFFVGGGWVEGPPTLCIQRPSINFCGFLLVIEKIDNFLLL